MRDTGPSRRSDEVAAGDLDLDDDLDDEMWDECEHEYTPEIGLPLRAENFTTGEPLVTVDYFDFSPGSRETIAERLVSLDDAVADDGARAPRILLFEPGTEECTPLALIAIATVLHDELRVETARPDMTDPVRSAVEAALGEQIRHRERRSENPIEVFLNDP